MSNPTEELRDQESEIVNDFLSAKSAIFAKLLKVQDEVRRAGFCYISVYDPSLIYLLGMEVS
jgi:hypothetical protein